LLGGEEFEGFAVVLIQVLFYFGARRSGEGDEDCAHWFFRGATARSSDAGDREGVIGVGPAAGALGHFAGDRFADRAVLRECFRSNAEEGFLGFVAVSDKARAKNGGSTRNIRDTIGDITTRAGFREGKGLLLFREEANDDGVQRFGFATVNETPEMLAGDFFRFAY
jgi:hypothetical protein